ncbi:hypothetical protein FRC03_008507 [Tulasnella sp. 419]|nr:hypothetical protein FRC03_008507 [Tulasnella sp. 419]
MEIQLPDYGQLDAAPLPAYTPQPSVGSSRSGAGSQVNVSSYFPSMETMNTSLAHSDFSYKTDNFTLDLGSKVWDAEYPAYGRGAVVQGWLTLQTTKYVSKVEVTVEGSILTTIVNRLGKRVPLGRFPLLRKSVNAFDSRQYTGPKGAKMLQLPFTVEIPRSPILPPSLEYTHSKSGVSVQIQYRVRVDMSRKLWKRGDSIEVPILYLPKSCPNPFHHNPPPLPDDYDWKQRNDLDLLEWKSIDLHPNGNDSPGGPDALSVKLEFPQPLSYKCGTQIPFRMLMSCRSMDGATTPQLRELFDSMTTESTASILSVTLLRIMTVVMSNKKVLSESVVSEGVVSGVQWEGQEAVPPSTSSNAHTASQPLSFKVSGAVLGGTAEGEMSWNVPGVAELQYAIRLTLSVPGQESNGTTFYRHTEIIGLNTHSREEIATEAGEDNPVLGLIPSQATPESSNTRT